MPPHTGLDCLKSSWEVDRATIWIFLLPSAKQLRSGYELHLKIPSDPAPWWCFWPFKMPVLRRTYVSALMESGAVAVGINKRDPSPHTRLKKQSEVCREEGARMLPANTGDTWSRVKTSVTLTSWVWRERCLKGSWTHSSVQWSVSTACSFRLSWAVLEESLGLGHMGSPLFLVGFPEHPTLLGWQCFPRASQFRGLHFMAKLPNLTRWLLGGEGCCWFFFSLMWAGRRKEGRWGLLLVPSLGPQLPELCRNHLPLATGGRCSTKKTQPGYCSTSSIGWSLGDEMMTLMASFCS